MYLHVQLTVIKDGEIIQLPGCGRDRELTVCMHAKYLKPKLKQALL